MYAENEVEWHHRLTSIQFDVGESYAGLVPISSAANETRKLFFWYVLSRDNRVSVLRLPSTFRFFPSTNPAATDEVVIWYGGRAHSLQLAG